MSTSASATIINGSFEFPLRGWDCMQKLYITLVLWIFMACVGAHAHLRNHFRSSGVSFLMLFASLSLLISKFSFTNVCLDMISILGYSYCRRRKTDIVIFPENEASAFLWGIAASFCLGVSVVGPVIEEAQLNLHGRSIRRLVITTLYCINIFICVSACVMFQPLERFFVPLIIAGIVIELLVLIFGPTVLFPNLHGQQLEDRILGLMVAIYWYGLSMTITGAFINESLEDVEIQNQKYIFVALIIFIFNLFFPLILLMI